MKRLKNEKFIQKVEEKPFIDTIQLNTEILEKKIKTWKKNKNEKRGGYDYIYPEKEWIGIRIKVANKYDEGNNFWLGSNNQEGEFAVAYSGLNPFINDDINNFGICLFQNPKLAEYNAGIVNIFGYKIMIMIMYRINPNKIVKSDKFNGCWVMNPTCDEIRPYRILLKIIPSLLTDRINISFSPINYIISAF